ncbi:MAG: alpha/beta hydrolase [Kofleriaceae bacterium]|nr:alpha/beta hydrolase [Kofleriaceae bacterium]
MVRGLQQKRLQSYDGTELCYYIGGSGPAVVLANGLGGPVPAYKYIIEQLISEYTVLTWDYRGMFGSGQPVVSGDLSVYHQVGDMRALMESEGIGQAVIVGWSMGVQVCCEYTYQNPAQVAGMVLLCGVAGVPFKTLPGGALVGRAIPSLLNVGKMSAKPLGALSQRLTQWKGFVPMMQKLGAIAPSLDSELFGDIAQEFAGMDMGVYCETLKQLGEHDGYDNLSSVRVPTLLVAGDKDLMTPKTAAQRMQSEIPGAKLAVVSGGTHYTPVEFPDRVGKEIDDFLRGVEGFEPASCRMSMS